jgi:predicted O-methyltransferase YrrM
VVGRNTDRWADVDTYFEDLFVSDAPVVDSAELPAHEVSPLQGKFLHLLARAVGARRVLELGTLAGHSAIWLGRALPPDGELVTIESDPRYAEVARGNLDRAGVRATVLVGRAAAVLPELTGAFDLIFIDADKGGNPGYFEQALRLSRPGTLIVADNTVRGGAVIDADSDDASVVGVRAFHDLVAASPHVEATALQTVGVKGYDGFTLVLVGAPEGHR